MSTLACAARALLEAITHDDSGAAGRGGNGGLISRETMSKADELRLALAAGEAAAAELHRCFICDKPFRAGELVLPDINEGLGHRACFGEDREGFCNLDTGEPLVADEPIPAGEPYDPAGYPEFLPAPAPAVEPAIDPAYDRGRRDMLNAILALNPAVAAKVARFAEREPDPEGRLPFDVVLWVTEVATQLGIEPREEGAADV